MVSASGEMNRSDRAAALAFIQNAFCEPNDDEHPAALALCSYGRIEIYVL